MARHKASRNSAWRNGRNRKSVWVVKSTATELKEQKGVSKSEDKWNVDKSMAVNNQAGSAGLTEGALSQGKSACKASESASKPQYKAADFGGQAGAVSADESGVTKSAENGGVTRPGIQEEVGRTNVHPEGNGREAGIRIYDTAGSLLLDVTEDKIEWSDGDSPRILESRDALRWCGLDELYTHVYPLGRTRAANSVSALSWGCDYAAHRTACPRCTLCDGQCERKGLHILCAHGELPDPGRGVHLWHDLRRRGGQAACLAKLDES